MPTKETSRKGRAEAIREESSSRSDATEFAAEGQAGFEMANLRPERTGLPFVVFISQRGGARHDVRLKVAPSARVRPSEMITVALRPSVRVVKGRLDPRDLDLLRQWIDLNRGVLIDYWDGTIGYTEDAMNALKPIEAPPR